MIVASQLLLLLLIANGAPIIARNLLGKRWNRPLDGGRTFLDGRPWLGASKTLRGILAAIIACGVTAALLGIPLITGVLAAIGAMLGDLLSSFTKRRLRIAPSAMAPGLDQIPESLLPTLLVGSQLGLTPGWGVATIAAFVALELLLSRILFALRIRKRPY